MSASKPNEIMYRWLTKASPSLTLLLAKIPVQQFFREFRALEFHQARILFNVPVKRHADLPGLGKNLGVLNGRLVGQLVLVQQSVALDHMQGVAVKIAGPVKPGLVI